LKNAPSAPRWEDSIDQLKNAPSVPLWKHKQNQEIEAPTVVNSDIFVPLLSAPQNAEIELEESKEPEKKSKKSRVLFD